MEPRGPGARTAKTWGHRNGEIVSNQINRHSSSTSDMDKVGLKQQYGHIKAAFAPATMICGAIGRCLQKCEIIPIMMVCSRNIASLKKIEIILTLPH